jgi:LPS-assembly protein
MHHILRNIFSRKCHDFSLLLIAASGALLAQAPITAPPARTNIPARDVIHTGAVERQESEGSIIKLRTGAYVETTEMIIRADEIDYDRAREYAEARGNVRFDYFPTGEHVEASKLEYNLKDQTGKFYDVRGTSPATVEARPGVLTTSAPFTFQGKWAERIGNRYLLHEGFITNCELPRPWWTLHSDRFDVIPNDRAIARNALFRLRRVPIFYTPTFYKSLERAPRKSGFLLPSFGNSSRRGLMLGWGYYWAINRSYDATYRAQLFTSRGFAHHVDFRGKPAQQTDFTFYLYGVNDRGITENGQKQEPASGFLMNLTGKSDDLPYGFRARGEFNYLSSFYFRQIFTESFYEAIQTEVQSRGAMSKYWDGYSLHLGASRIEIFGSQPYSPPDARLSLRKLPSVELSSQDREISRRVLPIWVSFQASGGLMKRNENAFVTRNFVDRLDVEPRIMTAFRWKGINLVPAFSLRETHYGSTLDQNRQPTGAGYWRHSREFSLEIVPPSVSRIFQSPPSPLGDKLKHVIEPRVSFRAVDGIGEGFHRIIRFDENELVSDTSQVEISLTNRLYSKNKGGTVSEILSWELRHRRYFDPDFGGAITPGQRNVLLASATLTGYTFLDDRRHYSPISSALRGYLYGMGLEWRADYDPARSRFVNSSLSVGGRFRDAYTLTVGHNHVRSVPITVEEAMLRGLAPRANQLFLMGGYGQVNRPGFSVGFLMNYDYIQSVMQFAQTQVSYNTDCCGWSVQFRRLGIGARSENQYRFAFAIANIGSFGTLREQERLQF